MNAPLVEPAVQGRVKNWRPYVEAKLGFRNHWYPALLVRWRERKCVALFAWRGGLGHSKPAYTPARHRRPGP